jgi:hypothetical protein
MKRYQQSKQDANQGEIVEALEKLGCTVLDLSSDGHGCPDILVGFRGMNYLAEIKQPKKQLSLGQRALSLWWRGGKVHVLRTEIDCVMMLGL